MVEVNHKSIFKLGAHWPQAGMPGFLKLLLSVTPACVCVCLCVCLYVCVSSSVVINGWT